MKQKFSQITNIISVENLVIFIATFLAISATLYSFTHGFILAYGDAESHLNIAKRVIHSLTPGLAQLGGIWLPLPHALMIPFVYFDSFWQTGLGGSVVSEIAFLLSGFFLYKLTYSVTKNKLASFLAFLAFALNPNILYMQSTPMTELPLIAMFILSTYFFWKFLKNDQDYLSLVLAAFWGFLATLTRYDGWFLVAIEAAIIILLYIDKVRLRKAMEGKLILFSTLAFSGIIMWLLWDFLILGDPLYFTNSPFSAKSQQAGWLARGELPAYRDIFLSFIYYYVTSLRNTGTIVFGASLAGFILYIIHTIKERSRVMIFLLLVLLAPFIFYIITLYLGQSVIFIPDLTPETFEWRLFNVRYGIMAVAPITFFLGFLFAKSHILIKAIIPFVIIVQVLFFALGYSPVITLDDGVKGLSSAKKQDAQQWMSDNYDGGLVLLDDYSRTLSIIQSNIPLQNVIYIGNKPYWEESLKEPEKYARWIVIQKDDAVWKNIYEDPAQQGRLFKYFNKAYTSPDILIFRRNS